MVVLKTSDLTKKFRAQAAVDHVNINIIEKDIYGLIGKNGAGKTTLMRMIVGIANPTEGNIELFESDDLNEGRTKIGNSMENPALYENMTAYENMMFYNKILGIKGDERVKELLTKVGLDYNDKKKTKRFSLGMKQRLAIGIALLNKPKLLVLDEPINGLDPEGIQEVRNLLLKLRDEENVTILISSHILGELDKVANRYGIINNGKLVKEFTKDDLENMGSNYINIKTNDVSKAVEVLKNKFNISKYKENVEGLYLYEKTDDIAEVNKELVLNDVNVEGLSLEGQNLEEYFMELIGNKEEDTGIEKNAL